MTVHGAPQGLESNERAGDSQNNADGHPRKRFQPAVPVGMFRVRRLGRHHQAEQDQAGCENVGGGFNSVGNDGGRVRLQAYRDLDRRKSRADEDARQRYISARAAGRLHFFFPVMSWWLPAANSAISFQSNLPPFTRNDTQPCCPT